MQKAYAWNQFTQLMGRFSFEPALGVQVCSAVSHARDVSQATFVACMACVVSSPFQVVSQPGSFPPPAPLFTRPCPPLRCVCLPEPAAGLQPPTTASTNLRKRPTVTSYLSRRKSATVAGKAVDVLPTLSFPRKKLLAPVTSGLVQQDSPLHSPSPGQLGGVAVQIPWLQNGVVEPQAAAAPYCPLALHVCIPLPEHRV
jgi:hypothetical protein